MRVVSLLSHSCALLPYQVAAFQTLMPAAGPLTVLQGPFGANGTTSGGTVRLTPRGASRLGVGVLMAPPGPAGLTFHPRTLALIGYARQQVPGDVLIVHGDLFPAKHLAPEELFRGRPAAGRVHGGGYPAFTWLALRDGVPVPRANAPADPSVFGGFGAGVDPAHPGLHFELCEPGFLHADKLNSARWPAFAAQFAAKVAAVAAVLTALGVEADVFDPCEELAGLADDAPRFGPPLPVPDDFDPEKERARLTQGGCCGAPAQG